MNIFSVLFFFSGSLVRIIVEEVNRAHANSERMVNSSDVQRHEHLLVNVFNLNN